MTNTGTPPTDTELYYIWLVGVLYMSHRLLDIAGRPSATEVPAIRYSSHDYPQITTTHNRYRTGDRSTN